MRTNHVKARLRAGEPSLGAWLALPGVPVARALARVGFEWLTVDMEHSAQDPALMAQTVAAIAEGEGCAPLVRVPNNRVEWFKWALDAGAWGVIVPMVSTRAEAEQAVQWSRFPPVGTRSIGGIFAPYSFRASRDDYMARINDEILVVVQIESVQALDNLDAILSVPGIDVAFVGPNDLHAQMHLPPSSEGAEPAFVAALEQIKQAARRHGVPLGIYSSSGEAAAARIREGFQMVCATSDASSLAAGARQHLLRATSDAEL
jgi:4-hydroxy-2-oxoheptanedioate aldolase